MRTSFGEESETLVVSIRNEHVDAVEDISW